VYLVGQSDTPKYCLSQNHWAHWKVNCLWTVNCCSTSASHPPISDDTPLARAPQTRCLLPSCFLCYLLQAERTSVKQNNSLLKQSLKFPHHLPDIATGPCNDPDPHTQSFTIHSNSILLSKSVPYRYTPLPISSTSILSSLLYFAKKNYEAPDYIISSVSLSQLLP